MKMNTDFWAKAFSSSSAMKEAVLPLPAVYSEDELTSVPKPKQGRDQEYQDSAQALAAQHSVDPEPEQLPDPAPEQDFEDSVFFQDDKLDDVANDVMPPLFDLGE